MTTKTPKLIFIAEDNAVYAKTLQTFLKKKFPETETIIYPVGELVIDNLNRKPDVVIMDYFLNSKYYDAADGLAVVKEIKGSHSDTHIIVLSAQQDIEVALTLKELGCHYLVKNNDSFAKIEEHIAGGK
jgi:DNA-binding NarL/FixJ family response regulator